MVTGRSILLTQNSANYTTVIGMRWVGWYNICHKIKLKTWHNKLFSFFISYEKAFRMWYVLFVAWRGKANCQVKKNIPTQILNRHEHASHFLIYKTIILKIKKINSPWKLCTSCPSLLFLTDRWGKADEFCSWVVRIQVKLLIWLFEL